MYQKRIYHPQPLSVMTRCELSASASHHVAQVLRMRVGDTLVLFDGCGLEYPATIAVIKKKIVQVELHESVTVQRESPLWIELGQGISRGDRMDYAIQKAVELGVNRITPLITERCNVKCTPERLSKRVQHWQGIIVASAEQSGRLQLPQLEAPCLLSEWFPVKKNGLCLVCDPQASACELPDQPSSVTVLIGPEGGLSESECMLAQNNGYKAWRLGPRVLRTETATVAALTCLQMQWGDL